MRETTMPESGGESQDHILTRGRPLRCAVAVLASFLLSPAISAWAQETPPSAALSGAAGQEQTQDFEPAGKYALEIDGELVPAARIYLSLAVGSVLLVQAPELSSPVLLRPQEQRVERVQPTDLLSGDRGALRLDPRAEPAELGSYEIDGTSLVWSDDERRLRLYERPMLGLHESAAVAAWDPQYARRARRYTPSRAALEALRHAEGARVRVYFGTWCPRCGQAVPKLMRVASELADSSLRFEYFGMPRLEEDATDSFWREAQEAGAFRDEVTIVPLVVVHRDGQRIGRIAGGWGNPERELEKILVDEDVD